VTRNLYCPSVAVVDEEGLQRMTSGGHVYLLP
jgi:hypothetical protein